MKKYILITLIIAISFGMGYAFSRITDDGASSNAQTKRVTGLGGIFFKSEDPAKLKQWYQKHLGFITDQWGTNFEWRLSADPEKKGYTHWGPFKSTTKYFNPSTKDFMINYRVENLERLVAELKSEGVTLTDTIEVYDYGKFVHIMDLEGNKIELWEPFDKGYESIKGAVTK